MRIPHSSKKRKRVGAFGALDVFHSESVLPLSTAAECYNFDFSSGALRDGYGVTESPLVPEAAKRYYVYRYYSESAGRYVEQYIYQLENGLLRFYDEIKGRHAYLSGIAYPPIQALNYKLMSKDVLLISCEGHGLIVWDGNEIREYGNSPKISSMAVHYERLFVTSSEDPTKVFFSDNLDPTNWQIGAEAGGFIELPDERGKLNRVVSFGGYLYIFRDQGISRITAFGDQTEFSAVNLFVTAGRIYPESIAACGNVIVFLASDGLYRFDGYECTRILGTLDGLIKPPAAASAYFNGKYYLSCALERGGETVGCEAGEYNVNGLIVYDVATGKYSVSRGLDVSCLSVCTYGGTDFLFCCDGGRGGEVAQCGARFGVPLKKRWRSPAHDFSAPDETKSLREVYIRSTVPCTLTLASPVRVKTKQVRAGDRRVRVNFSAKRLTLALETEECGSDIWAPVIIYGTHR